jgi:hypothetical protein
MEKDESSIFPWPLLIEKHTIEEMEMDLELGPIYSIQKAMTANSIT